MPLTQIRTKQISGSFVDLKTESQQYVTPSTAVLLTGSDIADVLGGMAAAIHRIHGAASSEPFNNAAGTFYADLTLNSDKKLQFGDTGTFIHQAADGKILLSSDGNAEDCILIQSDGGANETIRINSDQGTGVNAKGGSTDASISIHSDVGGIGLYTAINADNAITLEANGGANETIQVRSNQGTGVATADIANAVNASIALVSDVGGVALASGLNADGSIFLEADAGSDETIVVHSNQGTGVNTAGNSANASISLYSDVGGVGLYSGINGENAIRLEANGGANETIGINANQGTGVNAKGGSTDASINLVSDVGGIGLYTALNGDNAITLEANGGANETIQIRSNQGTGVATADIANAVNASIALVSDVGGVSALSGLNGAGAIWIGADAGTSETVVVHSHQGTGADSIKIYSDAGGVSILAGNTTHGVKIGTGTSGVPITLGHGTSEVTVADNFTVSGNATITGDFIVQGSTTTVSSSNTVFQDSIIGLGVSGSLNEDWNNAGDRAIIFARGAESYSFLPAINYDATNSEFEFATFSASPSSGSMGAPQAGVPLKTGHLKPITDDGATLGDANERWSDLFLAEGAVINFDNGDFTMTQTNNLLALAGGNTRVDKLEIDSAADHINVSSSDLTVTAGQDFVVDAERDIILDAKGEDIFLKKNGSLRGSFKLSSNLTLSSSAAGNLRLDTNGGTVALRKGGTEFGKLFSGSGLVLSSSANTALKLAPNNGNVEFRNHDLTQLTMIVENVSGDAVLQPGETNKDIIFKEDGGTEIFRLDSSGESLLLNGAKKIEFGDTGTFIHQSADGKLLVKSDGNAADAILIHADGGTSETIKIHADQGTALTSIDVKSDVGGIKLTAGLDNASSINLVGYGMVFDGGDKNDTLQFNNSPLGLEDIASDPTSTTAKLYNKGGGLYWSGNELATISVKRSLFVVTGAAGLLADSAVILTGAAGENNIVLSKLDSSDNVSFSGTDTFNERGRKTEVYVNGQLLLSGSVAEVSAGTRDYRCFSQTAIKFGFALETDDVIQVITR